jgi:F-type H+-transporting ATPase subunit delta
MEHHNVVQAEVTTAIPVPPDQAAALQQGLESATGRDVQLEMRVNPAILGGAVARIGSTVYDGSITTQLAKLKQQLADADA